MADETQTQEQAKAPEISAKLFLEHFDKISADPDLSAFLSEKFNPVKRLETDDDIGRFINENPNLSSWHDKSKHRFHQEKLERRKDELYQQWHIERNPEADPTQAKLLKLENQMKRAELMNEAIKKAVRNGLTEEDAEVWIAPFANDVTEIDRRVEMLSKRLKVTESAIRESERKKIMNDNQLKMADNKDESGKPTYTQKQIKEMFRNGTYAKHKDDLFLAAKEGRIVD